jgi:hypothetical protein
MRIKDRDDYRSMTDRELIIEIKEALHHNWQDLAMVLTERLVAAKKEKRELGYPAYDD